MTGLWGTCGKWVEEVAKTSRRVSGLFMPIIDQETPNQTNKSIGSPESSRSSFSDKSDNGFDTISVSSCTSVSSYGGDVDKPSGTSTSNVPENSGAVVLFTGTNTSDQPETTDDTADSRACIPYQPTHSGSVVKHGTLYQSGSAGAVVRTSPPTQSTYNGGAIRFSSTSSSNVQKNVTRPRLSITHESYDTSDAIRFSSTSSSNVQKNVTRPRLSITHESYDTDEDSKNDYPESDASSSDGDGTFNISSIGEQVFAMNTGIVEWYQVHSPGRRGIISIGPSNYRKYRIEAFKKCKCPISKDMKEISGREEGSTTLRPGEDLEILGVAFADNEGIGPKVLKPDGRLGEVRRIMFLVNIRWPDGEITWETASKARKYLGMIRTKPTPDETLYRAALHYEKRSDKFMDKNPEWCYDV